MAEAWLWGISLTRTEGGKEPGGKSWNLGKSTVVKALGLSPLKFHKWMDQQVSLSEPQFSPL